MSTNATDDLPVGPPRFAYVSTRAPDGETDCIAVSIDGWKDLLWFLKRAYMREELHSKLRKLDRDVPAVIAHIEKVEIELFDYEPDAVASGNETFNVWGCDVAPSTRSVCV